MSELLLNSLLIVLWLTGCVWAPHRKGYNPLCFMFGGVATMLALAFLPFTNQSNPPAPADLAARSRGNRVGLAMTILSVAAVGWMFFGAR